MADNNPLAWPQITHLPEYFNSLLDAHILYREDPESQNLRVRLPITKEELYEALFEISWFSNVKYDGTNVAIGHDKQLYGRRKVITGNSYQKTDISFLKLFDIAKVANEMLGSHVDKVIVVL